MWSVKDYRLWGEVRIVHELVGHIDQSGSVYKIGFT